MDRGIEEQSGQKEMSSKGVEKTIPDLGPDIKSMSQQELVEFVVSLGEKPFRGRQIYAWLHQKLVASFEEMTDLPKGLIQKLEETRSLTTLKSLVVQESKLDGTRKYLFKLPDGNTVETVLMKYKHGNSVCISSQVGCRMGCVFCASTLNGLVRSLSPGEMLDQIYRIQADLGERISNIVVMGIGEPLDNYENLLKFITMISDENGLNISQRNITVSTCGLVPRIRQLAEEKLQITLALSLHASDQEIRQELMPIAKKYGIKEVLEACRYYFEETGRRITFEYGLIAGENDSGEDAKNLASLLRGFPCHVNLIPINPIKERDFKAPDMKKSLEFKKKLEKSAKYVSITIRREMGRDIDGACGQLRNMKGVYP